MAVAVRHRNTGSCQKCEEIFNRYPGFYGPLKDWFKALQKEFPEAHISCAGRGEQEQEELFLRNATRAHFGKSAHNFNAAIDIFVLNFDPETIYPKAWFENILAKRITENLTWYGAPGAKYPELPHVEWKNWQQLVLKGELKLIGSKT